MELTHRSFFSGIGGFDLGAEWNGIKNLSHSEISNPQIAILKKNFPGIINLGDIEKIQNPGYATIYSGGFPCQDISVANSKAKGIKGERSRLWSEYYRLVSIGQPKYIIIENSPMLLKRGFEQILFDLSEIGYNAEWQCLSGRYFGLQQRRTRVYCIAYRDKKHFKGGLSESIFREFKIPGKSPRVYPGWRTRSDLPTSRFLRTNDVLSPWLDRVGAIGNSVIPLIAYYLFYCIVKREERIIEKRQKARI